MTRVYLLVLALCVLLGLAAPNASTAQVTTAAMNGRIVDDTGEVLAGATVVALHVPSGSRYGTVTREDGRYNLTGLRVGGPYSVTVTYIGYRTDTREGLSLTLGQDVTLNVTLRESGVEGQEVVVFGQGSSILNVDRTGAATNVSSEEIEALPTIARSIQDFTRLTPQINGGSAAGRNNRFNNIQVDGAVLNDVFGLAASGTPGGQAGTEPISLDAIEEFQVSIAPYDVRENGFTGASINAVTRSGTNRLTGSAYYFGRNESFVGDNATGAAFGDFSEFQTGFRIGGPIVRNKAFFFANAEIGRRGQPIDVGFSGAGNSVLFNVPQDSLAALVGILQNQYGYDAGTFDPFSDDSRNVKVFGRVDWTIARNHRLTLRHNFVRAQDDNITRNTGTFALSGNNYVFNSTQNSTVAQLNSTLSNRATNEFRVAYTRVRDNREPQGDPFPQVSVTLARVDNINRVARAGGETFSNANELDQDVVELTNNFSYFAGKHTLTAGTSNQFYSFRNLFIRELFGAYSFPSLNALRVGNPTSYQVSYSLTPDPRQAAEFSAYQLGLYAQDEYRALPNLTVTAGLRLDVPVFPDSPAENPTFAAAFPGRKTSEVPSASLLFSPRLGVNWDVFGNRTTQVRGGTGIFSGRTPFVWVSNQYSNTGVEFARINATNNAGLGNGFFRPDPANQPGPGQSGLTPGSTSEVNLTDRDFKLPQTWRTNVAVDQSLSFLGLVATVEGIISRSVNDLTYADINLSGQQATAGAQLGGRPLFGDPNASNNKRVVAATATYTGNPVKVSPAFTNVILLDNTNKGFETQMTVGVERRPDDGFFGKLAYTRSRAKNLNNTTSSQAFSQWRFNEVSGNPNTPDLATSDFEVRDRVVGAISYRFDVGRYIGAVRGLATTASLFYSGRSGSPFSYIYAGDANLDNQTANDLVYVPAAASEINLLTNNWAELDAFIEGDEYLRGRRGQTAERNGARGPWTNLVDFRLAQEVPTIRGQRFELTLDVLNVGNLVNKDFGQVEFVTNDAYSLLQFAGFDPAGQAQFRFTKPTSIYQTSDLASRWQMQLGLRYTF